MLTHVTFSSEVAAASEEGRRAVANVGEDGGTTGSAVASTSALVDAALPTMTPSGGPGGLPGDSKGLPFAAAGGYTQLL
ncbi:MAG: hypothetical protein ACKPKO_12400, partial [Candidatus Fonsibacter sp.]